MKKFVKENLKFIVAILASVILSSSVTGVIAYGIGANQVSYNTTSVADALDSMYQTMFSNNYSTSEKVVGTWIDGRPLYQITFTFTTANENWGRTNIATLSNNTEVRTMNGFIGNGYGINTYTNAEWFSVTVFENHILYNIIAGYKNQSSQITVQYTKSDDLVPNQNNQ